MLKVVGSALTRTNEFSAEGLHSSDRKVLFCKFCNGRVRHINSEKHVNNKGLYSEKKTSLQQTIGSSFQVVNKRKSAVNNFALKTTAAFLKENIPLEKLQEMDERIWPTGTRDLPTVKTLRENYVPLVAEERFATVKAEVAGKFVTVLADEITDKRGKCVFVHYFLETANSTLCSTAVLDSLKKCDVSYDSVLAFVSDGAHYMSKCCVIFCDNGQVLYVQYWTHNLCIIGNIWPKILVELNTAVVKAAFQNTRKCKHLYTQKNTDGTKKIIQFPVTVLTRWNCWFKSVLYVSEYLTDIIKFFSLSEMQNTPNAGIEYFSAIPKTEIKITQIQDVFVQEHTAQLMSLIDSLEGPSYPTSHILHSKLLHVKECFALGDKVLQAEVKQTIQRTASLSMDKLQEQMSTDPCRKTFAMVDNLFNPSSVVLNDVNSSLVTSFQTLPGLKRTNLTSADIARSYTRFKEIEKQPDVVEVLLSMKPDFPAFACDELRAVWLPCSNVDGRRFNLLEENTEIMTMFSFDQSR
ncbi:hypothetical protein PR048_031926 [Dryococelus australis]|uniref:DUF4371 domain-containing protein n=1 Tax=Dryococelus australis TaxID=614101 RepID=A0ABQ9G6N6_9NEOP|nr:hypothetical protein PR048_031926 [Dryococelus australis]